MKPRNIGLAEAVNNIFATYGKSVLWALVAVGIIGIVVRSGASAELFGTLSVTPYWFERGLSLLRDWHPGLYATLSQSALLMLFMKLIFAPVMEEAAFRYFPLTLAKNMEYGQIRAIIFVVGGIVFGVLHGHALNIFIQGVVGVFLGYLYLKNHRSDLMSYLSCVAVHMLYNFTVIMAQVLS